MRSQRKLIYFIFTFTLLPLIVLCFFNLPMGDDFLFGKVAEQKKFTEIMKYWYNGWGGRYTQSITLSYFNPIKYGTINFFYIPPLFLIVTIVLSVGYFVHHLKEYKINTLQRLQIFCLFVFIYFNLLPEIGETLYWISGAYTFQIANILTIVLVTTFLKLNNPRYKLFRKILILVLVILIVGCNEVSMAYLFGFSFLYVLYCNLNYKSNLSFALVLFCIILVCSIFVIYAPGNNVRSTVVEQLKGSNFRIRNFHKIILESIGRSFFLILYWIPTFIFFFIINWNSIKKIKNNFKLKVSNKYQVLVVIVFAYLILFFGILPSMFSTGWIPPRVTSVIFLFSFITLFVLILILFDVLNIYYERYNLKFINNPIIVLIFVLGFANGNNILNAYSDLLSGKVYKYHRFVDNLYINLSKAQKNDTVLVKPNFKKPFSLPERLPLYGEKNFSQSELENYFKVIIKTK